MANYDEKLAEEIWRQQGNDEVLFRAFDKTEADVLTWDDTVVERKTSEPRIPFRGGKFPPSLFPASEKEPLMSAYQSVNPATNKVMKTACAQRRVCRIGAGKAWQLWQSDWSRGPVQPRIQVLHKLADLIDSRAEELAKVASLEWASC